MDQVISLLEMSLPLDAIYLDKASHIEPVDEEKGSQYAFLEGLAAQIVSSLGSGTAAANQFLANLATIEPFNFQPTLANQIAQRLSRD